MSHHAKPAHWAYIDKRTDLPTCSCVLELHHRLEALEAAANHPAKPDSPVPAPAGGLMERVAIAVCRCDDSLSWREEVINWTPDARAAILAVAEWFDAIGYGATASILRQEVERG